MRSEKEKKTFLYAGGATSTVIVTVAYFAFKSLMSNVAVSGLVIVGWMLLSLAVYLLIAALLLENVSKNIFTALAVMGAATWVSVLVTDIVFFGFPTAQNAVFSFGLSLGLAFIVPIFVFAVMWKIKIIH